MSILAFFGLFDFFKNSLIQTFEEIEKAICIFSDYSVTSI